MTNNTKQVMMRLSFLGLFIFYLLVKFVFIDFLPEKLFIDSARIFESGEASSEIGNSFTATAQLFSLVPEWALEVLLIGTFAIHVHLFSNVCEKWSQVFVAWILLVPAFVFGLIVPNKDSVVMLFAVVVYYLFRYLGVRNKFFLILFVSLFYCIYALNFRSYYILIAVVWLGLIASVSFSFIRNGGLLLIIFLILLLAPDSLLVSLQEPRDVAFRVSEYILESNNRTSFENYFKPTGASSLVLNYIYAAVVLNIPFFINVGINEFLLFVSVLVCVYLVKLSLRVDADDARLTLLFVAHVMVLWLFEPDLGSYFRHYSSVILYLLPAYSCISLARGRKRGGNV